MSANRDIARVRTGSAITAAPSITLTFTPVNWRNPQKVIVVGVNDNVESTGGRTVNITFSASGGDYTGKTREIEATVTDDDSRDMSGIVISVVNLVTL